MARLTAARRSAGSVILAGLVIAASSASVSRVSLPFAFAIALIVVDVDRPSRVGRQCPLPVP